MKVLLMTSFAGIGFNNAPSIGLYRLKQFIEEVDVECDIVDFSLGVYDETLAKAKRGEYQVIGMSVSHYHMKDDISMIWEFKAVTKGQKCVFVAGGQEATYNYKNWITAGIDVIFLGYAERSLAAFCRQLKSNFEEGLKGLRSMEGVVYRDGKQFVFRPSRVITQAEFEYLNYEKVMDLDIPFEPYWQQVRENTGDLNFWTSVFITENVRLYTSSHCPNRCGFCSSHRFLSFSQQKTSRIFMLEAKQVFDLVMRYVQKDGARGFLFSDDEFLLYKKRVYDLCDYIIEAKNNGIMPKDVLFNCQTRVFDFLTRTPDGMRIDEKLIDKMLSAGFHSIGLGVETFVDRLLLSPSMNKRGFTEKDTLTVLEALIGKGLTPQINIILFIPEATRDEILYSIRKGLYFIRKGCQVAVTPLLYAVPGAPISDDPRYPVVKEEFVNKETGEPVEIKRNVIPINPDIAQCSMKIFDVFDQEVSDFKTSKEWEFGTVPKTLVGLLMFTSAAKLLKDDDLVQECEELKRDLIKENKQYA